MTDSHRPGNFRKAVGQLFSYMMRYRGQMLRMLACAVAGTLFGIFGPRILGSATNEIFTGLLAQVRGTGTIEIGAISRILAEVLALYLISMVFSMLQGLIMADIANDVGYSMRREIAEKIDRVPISYFDQRSYGDVLSRVTNDVDLVTQGVSESVSQLTISAATIAGVFVMMLTIDPVMTLAAVLILPAAFGIMRIFSRHSQKYFRQEQDLLGEVNGEIEEAFSWQASARGFSDGTFDGLNEKLYGASVRSQAISGAMEPAMEFAANLGLVAVAILGGFHAMRGVIGVGDIQAFFQYIRNFTGPITEIAEEFAILQSSIAASERVFEFLGEPEKEERAQGPVRAGEVRGEISFNRVSFQYDGADGTSDPEANGALVDFTAAIPGGRKVAIVGADGSGKTTIVKVLMRFYDDYQGTIRIDGYDIRDFNRPGLRALIAMAPKNPWLFQGTILENIRCGRPEATMEEVEAAAAAAHAAHFISEQPEGYLTQISEGGAGLSDGQKQLITLARVILEDKPILILDESVSMADTRTAVLIQESMEEMMKGRTTILLTHRPSVIRRADLILVMDHGCLAGQGTHRELMEQNGIYADLYREQFARIS